MNTLAFSPLNYQRGGLTIYVCEAPFRAVANGRAFCLPAPGGTSSRPINDGLGGCVLREAHVMLFQDPSIRCEVSGLAF